MNSSDTTSTGPRGAAGADSGGGASKTPIFSAAVLGRVVGQGGTFMTRWFKCGSFYFWLDLVATLSLMFGE